MLGRLRGEQRETGYTRRGRQTDGNKAIWKFDPRTDGLVKREIVICEALAPLSRRNSRRVVSSNQFGDSRDVAGIWDGRIRIDAEEEEGLRFFPAMLNRRSLRSWDLWINSHDRAGLAECHKDTTIDKPRLHTILNIVS